jgi:hypothetical protein
MVISLIYLHYLAEVVDVAEGRAETLADTFNT